MSLGDVMPTAFVLKAILVPGGAFRSKFEFWDEGAKERFFFVANKNPGTAQTIFMVTATSQINQRQAKHAHRASKVLVYLSKAEYPDLTVDSVIDCDCALRRVSIEKFKELTASREFKPLPRLPEAVIAKIHEAIAAAKTLSPVEKRAILGPEPDGGG